VTPREAAEKIAVFLKADVKRPHVENDWPRDKERWRAGKPGVKGEKPVGERFDGLEDVGQKGLSSKL
jgi:hypothetical protein